MTETTTDTPFADDEACAAAICRMGEIDRDLAVLETTKAEAIQKAAEIAETAAEPLIAERSGLFAKVKAYCEANRRRLTNDGRTKTAKFTSGEAAWKLGRLRVNVDSTLKDKIIGLLKKRGLTDLVRIKEDIDIGAVGKARDKVKGIKGFTFVEPTEDFSVSPMSAELTPRS